MFLRRFASLRSGAATVLIACLLVCPLGSVPAADSVEFVTELSMQQNVDALLARMPDTAERPNTHLQGDTSHHCASHALRIAKDSITAARVGEGAWESFLVTVELAQDVLSLYGLGAVVPVIELAMAALDASSPEEYLQNMAESATKWAGGQAASGLAGKYGEALEQELGRIEDELFDITGSRGAGWLWGAILDASDEKLYDAIYEHPHCGPVSITIWLAKRSDYGLELRVSVSGDCECEIPAGDPVKLGDFSVYGVIPLEAQPTREGDTLRIGLRMEGDGEYWVEASCDCDEEEDRTGSGVPPGDDESEGATFLPSEGYKIADRICYEQCWDFKLRAWDAEQHAERKRKQADVDTEELRDQADELEREADRLEQEYEEAKRTQRETIEGSPTEAQREALADAHATVDRWRSSDSRRVGEWRERADELRDQADRREREADQARRDAEAAQKRADHWRERYWECLDRCIRNACQAGDSFGTGTGGIGLPPGAKEVQDDVLDRLQQMRSQQGFRCAAPGSTGQVGMVAGGSGVRLVSSRSEWCTYGETTTPVPGPAGPGSPPDAPGQPPDRPGAPPPGPGGGGEPAPPSPPGGAPSPGAEPEEPRGPDDPAGAPPGTPRVPTPPAPGGEEDEPDQPPAPEPEEDPGEEPRDEPEDRPVPTTTLTIKAKKTVLEGGGQQAAAVPEAMVKLDLGPEPALPVEGNQRADEGYDQPPAQGLTGPDGTVQLAVPAALASALPASGDVPEIEVDLTPRSSTIVHVPAVDGAVPALEGVLQPELLPYVSRQWLLDGTSVVVLGYPRARSEAVRQWIAQSDGIVFSEPNYCRDKQEGPDDPYFSSSGTWGQDYADQWAIKRVGFTAGPDSAWRALGPDPAPVTVAVIDTGLDWNHADISWSRLWRNDAEVPGNRADDDGNGYVDDVIGWDFVEGDGSPWDRDGHGTFVAGVIAAATDNGVGIAGINPHARIMVLRALNSFGQTRAAALAEAIVYAAEHGARVVNISAGGSELSRTEQLAVDHAREQGAVIVVAAGNEGSDAGGFSPAGLERVIAVASTDAADRRAAFSNWGAMIDVAAPGTDVLSLRARRTDLMHSIPGVEYESREAWVGDDQRYFRTSGTSFSAPIVAGVASAILSRRPDLTAEQVERMLLHTAQDIETPGFDQYTGYGLVDARAALAADPGFFVTARITGVKVVRVDGDPVVRVLGSTDADALERAWLAIGRGAEPNDWQRVSPDLTAPVRQGVLHDVPAESFRGSPVWMLRLITEHENGTRREARFRLNLGG